MTQSRLVAAKMVSSVRSLQRAKRIYRSAPDLEVQIMAGTLKLGPAEHIAIEREEAAALQYFKTLVRNSE